MMFPIKIFVFLLTLALTFGQGKKPVTADDLIQMKQAGFDEQTILKAIETNGAMVDTSAQGLVALKNAGLSESVIRAALSAGTLSPATPRSSSSPVAGGLIPEEVGVYFLENGMLRQLPTEAVKTKGPSPFKIMATGGFGTMKMQGTVSGANSPVQLSGSIVLVLRCPEGMNADGYQLLLLDSKKNHREFTTAKSSFFRGTSHGPDDKDATAANFEKIGSNTYKASFSSLQPGEYGMFGLGAVGSSARMYTFGVH